MSRKNVNLVFPKNLVFEQMIDVVFLGSAKNNRRVQYILWTNKPAWCNKNR